MSSTLRVLNSFLFADRIVFMSTYWQFHAHLHFNFEQALCIYIEICIYFFIYKFKPTNETTTTGGDI